MNLLSYMIIIMLSLIACVGLIYGLALLIFRLIGWYRGKKDE